MSNLPLSPPINELASTPATSTQLLGDIRRIIEQTRTQLATTVNSTLTTLYWQIGQRIRSEVLQQKRAAYGEQIVSAVRGHLS